MVKTLVLGPMPSGATAETHIASGPWCFTGREQDFPGWDRGKTGFFLPPDPYPTAVAMEEAARQANGEIIRLTAKLGMALNAQRGVNFSGRFWEVVLVPWLTVFTHSLFERRQRMVDLVSLYGRERLRVVLLPKNCPISFDDSLDFMLHGALDLHFNHYLFSRLAEAQGTAAWTCEYLPERPLGSQAREEPGRKVSSSFKSRLQALARNLPFPWQKGFSLWQALLLSREVAGNFSKKTGLDRPDRTLPLEKYADRPPEWARDFEWLAEACIPLALAELPLPLIPRSRGKLLGMTAAVSQDDRYRLRLAAWREGGGRLFSVQHGANYGNLRSIGGSFFEYRQHAFITWGWSKHEGQPCNAVPLPHPLPGRLHDAHREEQPSLILVGTEMSPYLYRLKSRPQAGQLVSYRQAKLAFLESLPEPIRQQCSYRPYPQADSFLEDAGYVSRLAMPLSLCQGDLTRHMLGCRLLVLDHYGTTLHLALASNTPVICYWNPDGWGMENRSQESLDRLAQAGVLFASPQEAAEAVATVWNRVGQWWAGIQIQEARQNWLDRYCLCLPGSTKSKEWLSAWRKTIRSL